MAIFNFRKQFQLLDAHLPIISHFVKHSEYRPDLLRSPIELIDYSRGFSLVPSGSHADYLKYHQIPLEEGLHLVISGDVNVEMLKEFVESHSTIIRDALDATSSTRIKRFVPISSLDKYIKLADEYYFYEGNRPSQETIAHNNNVSPSVASKWIKQLKPIMPLE